jgi:hypothetical protein
MNMNLKSTLHGVAGTALLALSMSANAYNIDLFTDFQSVGDDQLGEGVFATNATSTLTGLDTNNVIGGTRTIQVDCITSCQDNVDPGTYTSPGDLGTTMVVSGGALQFSNDSSGLLGAAGTGFVQWDGTDNGTTLDPTGLGGQDLTADGSDAFIFTVLNSDADFEFVIEAYTDADNWTRVTIEAQVGDLPEIRVIPFDDIGNAALCGSGPLGNGVLSVECGNGNTQPFMATSAGAFQIFLNTGTPTVAEIDLAIGAISTTVGVPEPSLLGLLGLGMLAGGFVRVRARNSKK